MNAARAAYAALFGAIGASVPYLAVYYQSQGLGLDLIGLLSSLSAGVGLLGAPLWGWVADRFPRSRLVLPAASLVAAGGALALALVRGPTLIVVAATMTAFAVAGIAPVLDARALEVVEGDRDRYGRLRAWGSAAFIVLVWVTGFLVAGAGSASLFWLYVPLLVLTAATTLPLRGSRSASSYASLAAVSLVLRQPALARFLLAALVVWSSAMAITWFFTVHLLEVGTPGALVGTSWALGALVEIPVMWSYPALAARIATERLLVIGAVAMAVRAVAVALLANPVLVTLTMAVHGLGFGLLLVGGVTYVARHAPPAVAATAQGVLSATVFSLAIMIGPGLGGIAADAWGLRGMFLAAAISGTIGIGALALAVRSRWPLLAPA